MYLKPQGEKARPALYKMPFKHSHLYLEGGSENVAPSVKYNWKKISVFTSEPSSLQRGGIYAAFSHGARSRWNKKWSLAQVSVPGSFWSLELLFFPFAIKRWHRCWETLIDFWVHVASLRWSQRKASCCSYREKAGPCTASQIRNSSSDWKIWKELHVSSSLTLCSVARICGLEPQVVHTG